MKTKRSSLRAIVQVSTGRQAKRGEDKLVIGFSKWWRLMVKAMQVIDQFDRVQLTVIASEYGVYGSVSGRLSQLCNEGYIRQVVGCERFYPDEVLLVNPDLDGVELSYACGGQKRGRSALVYEKTSTWPLFMKRWSDVVLKHREEVQHGQTELPLVRSSSAK